MGLGGPLKFVIDGEEIDLQSLGQEAQNMAERRQQLRDEIQILEMRQKENLVLMNTYAASIKQMANPDPKIEIVKKWIIFRRKNLCACIVSIKGLSKTSLMY